MNSTNNDENEPPPSEDEDRSLLFGPPKEGTEPAGGREKPRRPRASASSPPPRTSPPAAEAVAEPSDPAGRAGPLASSDGGQRRILALLEGLEEKVAGPAAGEADLAAAVRTIAEQAEQIGAATEWVNDVKAAISEILASTGKQIKGLKSGQNDLDAALARLKILEEGLDRVVQALDATAKGLDRRSSELEAVKQELAKYYGEWTAEAKTSRGEMKALSKRLDAGDHMVTRLERLQKGWTEQTARATTENAAARRSAAEQTSGVVEKLASTGSAFLERFDEGRADALKEIRREWTRTRRWTAPALAAALVLAAPSFAVVGAVGQSEFGVFEPYDDTRGWKEGVWKRHGVQVRDCMLNSMRTKQVIRCSFDVEYP